MTTLDKLYYVNLGNGGRFSPDGAITSTPDDVDALFAHIARENQSRLVLFFHGGLTSEASGIAGASGLLTPYQRAGSHPVFFIWETGFRETFSQRLRSIAATSLFKRLIRILIAKVGARIGVHEARGAGTSLSTADIEAELARDAPLDDYPVERGESAPRTVETEIRLELEEKLEADESLRALLAVEAPAALRPPSVEGARGPMLLAALARLAKVAYASIRRFAQRSDHGFYPTVVEELLRHFYLADFGAWIWDGMKSSAADMWLSNEGLEPQQVHGGRYFLEKLSAHQASHPGFVVDVVGHSAGAIAICHMVRAIAEMGADVSLRNVVFLAPACNSELFMETIYRRRDSMRRFRVFAMNDEHECRDRLVPGIYPRSLLYLVSGVFESRPDTPILGLRRHWTGVTPYDTEDLVAVSSFLTAADVCRSVLSPTDANAPLGLRCGALHHGGFAHDQLTVESVTHLLAEG